VIDGANDSVITTVTVGYSPWDLVYNSTNNKVYCTNINGGNVTVIDGAADTVIATILVGNDPYGLVYNSINNKVYSANSGSDNVTVIDGATNTYVSTITVGDYPRVFAWDPVQNRTYVANYADSSVSVIRDWIGTEEDYEYTAAESIVQIFPNPANMSFTIQTAVPVRSVAIYDVVGKAVRTAGITKHDNEKTICVKHLNAGIYFLKINTDDNELIRKVIMTK
jgi:YVTN family beta-propeller protein